MQAGAELVCFPEAFLSGYTRDPTVARARATSLGSPAFQSLCRKLSRLPATLILGLIETDGDDLFNTAAVITAGRLTGTYRKRHPVEGCFTPGGSLPVFDAGGIRFGIGICSDARHPDDAITLAGNGARAIFYPLNNMLPNQIAKRWRHRHASILQHRARQAGVWVLSADVTGHRQDQRSYGASIVVDPTGALTGRVAEDTTGIVLTRIARRSQPSTSQS